MFRNPDIKYFLPGTRSRRLLLGSLLALVGWLLTPETGGARPERIVPGDAYFSQTYTEMAGVSELGVQRNYEEVYMLYTYYEGVYDAKLRMERFRAFERGQVIWEERYYYPPDGAPPYKERTVAGQAPKRILLGTP
ncbi:MAG: hypothetical protein OEW39_03240 [Deltaproteobacteria bacterium]|nr:hypothetical protein [Deltaproteobacteria bacterium]